MKKMISLLSSMFKIGLIGFGGGNALIPVIEQTAVEEQKLITAEEYEEDIVVASITPGALPVELAGGIGRRLAGRRGMVMAASAMAFPGMIFTLLLISWMTHIDEKWFLLIQYLTVGISAFICCLLVEYIKGTFKGKENRKQILPRATVAILVFALTCGKNLYRIIGTDASPIFSIATIDIFALAFFIICFTNGKFKSINMVLSAIVGVMYILCVGRWNFFSKQYVGYAVKLLMLIMALYVIKRSTVTGDVIKTGVLKQLRDETIALILFFGILAGTSELITGGGAAFLWKGLLSSLMSFGGGDAYLTVADGLFVQSEIITEDQFYSTLVPTVNILPGSILCKTLSGIGYLYGLDQIGTHAGAIAMAVIGFACSVVASCGVFTLVGYVYECFGNLTIFRQIKKWIRPIVSGLMGNVMLSLIYQSKKLGIQIQKPWIPIWVMIGIFVVDMMLQERYGTKRVVAILIAAVMSVGILCVVV